MAAKPDIIISYTALKSLVEKFLASDIDTDTVAITCTFRRAMREFKTLYPTLYYFAYGMGKEYTLVLSKNKFEIEFKCLTPKCKKIFIDNAGLRIVPTISDALVKRLDPYLNLRNWFALLSDVMHFVGGEKEFISKHFDLQSQIVEDIKKSPAYNAWKDLVVTPKKLSYTQKPVAGSDVKPTYSNKGLSNNIYCIENNGKYFMSIDLKAANFQVLRTNGLITEKTWPEYTAKFINHPYFGRLKVLRMKILSDPALYPSKQSALWSNTTLDILSSIIERGVMNEEDFAIWNSDEIVFHVDKESMAGAKVKCTDYLKKYFPDLDLEVNVFQLQHVDKTKQYFAKIDQTTNKIDFKCANAQEFPHAVELWNRNFNN